MQMFDSSTVEIQHKLVGLDARNDAIISADHALERVQNLLLDRFADHETIRIYEAGGGSLSYLPPELLDKADITVVDIDGDQIKNNSYAKTKILGDIQTCEFPSNSFDLVSCYFVIEHIERPDKAIERFFDALAPNGLAFIAAPNPNSFTGIVAKYTPHRFHVWFYRSVVGIRAAGLPGNAPFPIVYHPLVSPTKLIEFCKWRGYEIAYFKQFESVQIGKLRRRYPLLGSILNAFLRGLEIVSRRSLREGDFHIILRKPALAKTTHRS